MVLDLSGQERFFNYLDGWTNMGLIETEGGYLSYGILWDDQFENQISFQELEVDGLPMNPLSFSVDTSEYVEIRRVNSIYSTPSGEIFSASYIKGDISEKSFGLLTRHSESLVDSDLSVTFDFAEERTFFYSVSSSQNQGNLILTSGLFDEGSAPRAGITEVDSSGNIIWHQEFVSDSDPVLDWLLPWHILPTPDGGYLLTALDLIAPNNSFDVEHHATLIKLDSVGEVEWRIYPDDPDYWSEPGWPVLLDDGSVFFSWSDTYTVVPTIDNSNPNNTIHSIMIDLSDGSTSNEQDYSVYLPTTNTEPTLGHQYLPTQTQMLSDGNILISGYDLSRAFFMKVNQSGDHIWHRQFYNPEQNGEPLPTGQSSRFMVKGVTETSDGGFICGGEFTATPGNDIWPSGIQSAFALKLDSYGCLEEGCHLADGLWEPGSSASLGVLRLWPNPTTGALRVDTPSGVRGAGWQLHLYDALGRQVPESDYSIQLQSETDQGAITLDLHGLPTGLYVLSLSSDEGVYIARIHKV